MSKPDNPDLNVTTDNAKLREETAFRLGAGDGEALADSGLIARSNAALNLLEQIKNRKEKTRKFEEAAFEQLRQSLHDIKLEMDWLDDQIRQEEKAIQHNNHEIDFIRTLDENNIYGADGNLRDDVSAILAKYGYDDLNGKSPDEIMHILQTIETDLHGDNIIRLDRIDGYRDRHAHLREKVEEFTNNLPEGTPEDVRQQAEALAERQPVAVNARASLEAHTVENDGLAGNFEDREVLVNQRTISTSFSMD